MTIVDSCQVMRDDGTVDRGSWFMIISLLMVVIDPIVMVNSGCDN